LQGTLSSTEVPSMRTTCGSGPRFRPEQKLLKGDLGPKLDRLARSPSSAVHGPTRAVQLSSGTDLFVLHLYTALAEKERRLIAKAALAVRKASGARLSNPTSLMDAGNQGRAGSTAYCRWNTCGISGRCYGSSEAGAHARWRQSQSTLNSR
jgi:hypothetical protein